MIVLTIVLNLYGTLLLVGGALYSAFLFWRKRVLAYRVIGNVLIAAGALLPASAGTFVKLGLADWLYVSELLGAILMFTGFLQATSQQPATAPVAQPAQPAQSG
jgi:sulfite exporter TauE/SafE